MKICVVGLGYVGLPLAVRLSEKYTVTGLDSDQKKIAQLRNLVDVTHELEDAQLNQLREIDLISCWADAGDSNVYIVAVPTPVNEDKEPDLSCLKKACEGIANNMSSGALIIFESTVYPGCTRDFCVPILEFGSGLSFNREFKVGYSPERINPGDKHRTLSNVTKIISASDSSALEVVSEIYNHVTHGNIYIAKSIEIAEAAKIIENVQRDLNIALINELACLFEAADLDVYEVLDASKTKWNFLDFTPGLVGGHCIGVDPYYLTHWARLNQLKANLITAGRELNDRIAPMIADRLASRVKTTSDGRERSVLIFGCSFKANVADIRNSKVFELANSLLYRDISVFIFDPVAYFHESESLPQGVRLLRSIPKGKCYAAIVYAVNHSCFSRYTIDEIDEMLLSPKILIDITGRFSKSETSIRKIELSRV